MTTVAARVSSRPPIPREPRAHVSPRGEPWEVRLANLPGPMPLKRAVLPRRVGAGVKAEAVPSAKAMKVIERMILDESFRVAAVASVSVDLSPTPTSPGLAKKCYVSGNPPAKEPWANAQPLGAPGIDRMQMNPKATDPAFWKKTGAFGGARRPRPRTRGTQPLH